jgi:hypothetical protein
VPPERRPLLERFWPKVDRRGPGECWPWLAGKSHGYGVISAGGRYGRRLPAHRVAYEALVGPIPPGLVIDHLCRNTACCNPAHMEPVTAGENVLRGVGPSAREARMTHCDQGHPLSGDNLYIAPKTGKRNCRTCRNAKTRAWIDANREYKRAYDREAARRRKLAA